MRNDATTSLIALCILAGSRLFSLALAQPRRKLFIGMHRGHANRFLRCHSASRVSSTGQTASQLITKNPASSRRHGRRRQCFLSSDQRPVHQQRLGEMGRRNRVCCAACTRDLPASSPPLLVKIGAPMLGAQKKRRPFLGAALVVRKSAQFENQLGEISARRFV
ncbi:MULTISPECIES: hypothetical protein [Paraburkholderia]|uniref:hypothetical protein n=1 Tax=Paraburkholderia TaxID=1822464 RepID=UPI0038B884A9